MNSFSQLWIMRSILQVKFLRPQLVSHELSFHFKWLQPQPIWFRQKSNLTEIRLDLADNAQQLETRSQIFALTMMTSYLELRCFEYFNGKHTTALSVNKLGKLRFRYPDRTDEICLCIAEINCVEQTRSEKSGSFNLNIINLMCHVYMVGIFRHRRDGNL